MRFRRSVLAAVMGVVNAGVGGSSGGGAGHADWPCTGGHLPRILIAYGFVLPLATLLRQKSSDPVKILQCIKVTLLSA